MQTFKLTTRTNQLMNMIWKLYKTTAKLLLQCVFIACSRRDSASLIDRQRVIITAISRIINCIRGYHSMHPNFALQQYGSVDVFLKQQLSESDWFIWAQLQGDPAFDALSYNDQFLKIA